MDAILSTSNQGDTTFLRTFGNLDTNSALPCFNVWNDNVFPEKRPRYCIHFFMV